MGQYGKIRCPVCYASIETQVIVKYCPACKERIIEKLQKQGEGLSTTQNIGSGNKTTKRN